MKGVIAFVLLGVALLVQFCLLVAWGDSFIVPNVTLALLVMLSFYVDVEQMMWLALLGGLFSDLYSQTEFGLYLGLYILVILVCKMVVRFDNNNRSWWLAILVLAAASLLQAVILSLPLISAQFNGSYLALAEQTGWFVVLTTAIGLIFFICLRFANQSFSRYFQAKAT